MAAATMRAEYAANTVYGNVAYDLNRVNGYALPQEEEVLQPSPEELARERVQERLRERELARARAQAKAHAQTFGVPVLGILGILVVAALMIFVLFGYVELAEISAQTTRVKNDIAALNEQSAKLRIDYEMAFNLAEVETYAVNILGMTRMGADNVTVLGIAHEDKAEILSPDDTAAGWLARAGNILDTVLAYFK